MENKEAKKHHWLQVKHQCGDFELNLYIPAGFTDEQAVEIEKRLEDACEKHGNKNDGDYSEFDNAPMFERVLETMGIEYEYPPADYTIYI